MKFFVTTPIYYVNAKPHIGSAYTTIAADVLARWHRQQGNEVHFLTGTAEHGTKMANCATEAGKTPQVFVDENSGLFQRAWKTLNISCDDFIRTTEPRHERAVIQFFKKLKESGKIYESEYEGLYCVGHEAFIKESELDKNGNCPDHGQPPQKVKEKNWFFKLSDYAELLRQRIESDTFVIQPENIKREVLSFIQQGLNDISISRQNVTWAIPLPWDQSQTIYVWLDELCNYCSAVGYGVDEKKFRNYWPADLHLIGKDLIKFHCIIWPALLEAINEPWPKKVFAHGFFTVDGHKMSKSLGNIVDPIEVAEEYGVDAVRYFILRDIPFGNDGDFSHERLHDRYNADLANGLGNLVSRTLTMIEKFWPDFDSSASLTPDVNKETSGVAPASGVKEVSMESSVSTPSAIDDHLNSLDFDKALAAIWEIIAGADHLIEDTKPWELAKEGNIESLKGVLGQAYEALQGINKAIAPFMPETHQKLTALLTARPLKKPVEPLFARK